MPTRVTLPGSKRTLLPNSRPAGPIDPTEIASLTVRTRSAGDVAALEKRVHQQSREPLAKRTYLTREELARGHGAKPEDLDLVEQLAHEHDLVVVHRNAAERSIVLRGKLGNLLSLFPADVQMYHHSSGTYRGRQGEIEIPKALDGIVTGRVWVRHAPETPLCARRDTRGCVGSRRQQRRRSHGIRQALQFSADVCRPDARRARARPSPSSNSEADFAPAILKCSSMKSESRPRQVTAISVDHAGHKPTTADSADGEVMLDIEVAGAVAPKAKFAVYFAPNNGDQGFIDGISAAVHDSERNPSVISISWGGPESSSDQQGITAFHELFVAAAAVGITVCVASGDHGTADSDAADWDGKIHVDHPAVDDMVLGCGGTQIDKNDKDVVWNDGTPFDQERGGRRRLGQRRRNQRNLRDAELSGEREASGVH